MRWRTRTGADHILAILRKVLNGHAARSDEFKNPLQGMNSAGPTMERASRTRILQDAELRAFWRATETFPGAYGHLLRVMLRTAIGCDEAAEMIRRELTGGSYPGMYGPSLPSLSRRQRAKPPQIQEGFRAIAKQGRSRAVGPQPARRANCFKWIARDCAVSVFRA